MRYDVIIIGAGHAGCEAALSSARMGRKTCLFTMNLDTIAHLSCNPAIGGLAKGHLVREIDSLGGEMAKIADLSGIQFRMLNMSKGPAVRSLRSQADRNLYKLYMRRAIERQDGLSIKQETVESLIAEGGKMLGVRTNLGIEYNCGAVVVTTGTFLKGLIHIGLESHEAGRAGEFPSKGLSDSLRSLGLGMGRLKTGTPPRLDAKSIDFTRTTPQWGDNPPVPFSYGTKEITNPQLPCYITYTNPATHRIIMESLDRSPLYSGRIQGIGPRYCPSIEDKVVRFKDKERHQIFLEPEGLETREYYANGISTSLPYDIQLNIVRSVEALEEAEIMRPAYAIEYDFVHPTELKHSLETKKIKGLFLAGQINGTSGYEEAGAQGLMAGINAALSLEGREPLVLKRHEAYIGVLIDDLVTKGTNEPYRMFTSRAEYRLLLRHGNADMRLRDYGRDVGLVGGVEYAAFSEKRRLIGEEVSRLEKTRLKPEEVNKSLLDAGTSEITEAVDLMSLLKRPELDYAFIERHSPPPVLLADGVKEEVEVWVKYEGYIARQTESAEKLKRSEAKKIPVSLDYAAIPGLSNEIIGKLRDIRPENIGQASRIPGVTPAALAIILVSIEKGKRS